MPSIQPVLPNSQGAILTVGLLVNGERVAIVEPYGLEQAAPDKDKLCEDLVESWVGGPKTLFLAGLSQDASIVFASAEGMMDGTIPFRLDFAVGDEPGNLPVSALPANVTGLIAYYQDPVDVAPGDRMAVAKTFMPAVPTTHVVGQTIDDALKTLYIGYGGNVTGGFDSVQWPGHDWWRMLAAPKPRATPTNIKRIISVQARGYVCTQKRRLVPR